VSEWLPIKRPPQNYALVLVYDPRHGVCAARHESGQYWLGTAELHIVRDTSDFCVELFPTHWQDLHTPPTGSD
jgi:hypothetical protein